MKPAKKLFFALILSAALTAGACAPKPAPILPSHNMPVAGSSGQRKELPDTGISRELNIPVPENIPVTEGMPLQYLTPLVASEAKGSLSDLKLSIPSAFNITRPEQKLTTTFKSYFITGTSDPSKPLYFGGKAVERPGNKGTFGVYVELIVGNNNFTFKQGGETKTVTIVRVAGGVSRISDITQSSMFPAAQGGAKAGGTLPVSCIAPSGAKVTASFGGKGVELTQSKEAAAGLPVAFTGKLPVGTDYDSDVTEKIGQVIYKMNYNGTAKTYKSTGDVYIAGQNSRIAIRVKEYVGFVYPDISKPGLFKEYLKKGAVDAVSNMNNEYFQLASGGYMPVAMAEIIEGKVSVSNKLSGATSETASKYEAYTFAGTNKGVYTTKLSDSVFTMTFYNAAGTPGLNVGSSKLFSSVSVSAGENNTVTYTFTFKNRARLWGWNVAFDGANTVLRFNYKPSLSSSESKPFEGLTILLDPGHGGSDSGAFGLAGKTGPAESVINLAHAYATRDVLTKMGAKVYLTRTTGDDKYSLDDRIRDIEAVKADLFLSIHHNSLAESADANKVSGMEIYYHNPLSKKLADTMMQSLASGLGRNTRFVNQSYYRVTLMPYCPAILIELGYLCNPVEYERSVNTSQINKAAASIAGGIKSALA